MIATSYSLATELGVTMGMGAGIAGWRGAGAVLPPVLRVVVLGARARSSNDLGAAGQGFSTAIARPECTRVMGDHRRIAWPLGPRS